MTPRKAPAEAAITERAQHFLKVLIERYIQDGHPVGSRTLAKEAGMDLSPATIRNVMSDLEEMGLVASPHTSAGRIPTASGFRMFVDSLLTIEPLEEPEVAKIRERLDVGHDKPELLESASQLLSGITNMAGVVMIPRSDPAAFRQIEFLRLSGKRVLAILVTSQGEVHNRIIDVQRAYSASQLEQAANYLNAAFAGQDVAAVRRRLMKEMQDTRTRMNEIMSKALEMAGQVFDAREPRDDCLIAGQTNLMGFDELASMQRLRQLFDAFTEKHEILHLLDESMRANGIQIFIGEESGYQPLDFCSLVTAPYDVNGKVVGVLGVIGPTRMSYERVIPIVDVTAKLLGAALKQK